MKLNKLRLFFMTLMVVVVFNAINIQANGNFDVTLNRYDALGNPIVGSQVVFDGTSGRTFYTNRIGEARLTWSETSVNNFNVFYTSGGVEVPLNSSPQTSQYSIFDGANLPEGTYTLTVVEDTDTTPKTSNTITFIVDTTAPAAVGGLNFTNLSDVSIGTTSNLRNFKINWSGANDTGQNSDDAVAQYEVRYLHTGISSTLLDANVTGNSYTVSFASSFADRVITFQVFSIDKAGNRNTTPTTIQYTLNSSAPNPPTALVVRNATNDILTGDSGGNFQSVAFTASTSTVTSYEVAVRASDSATYAVVQSGSTAVTYTNIFSGLSFSQGARVSVRVVAIDAAGNRSSELTRTFVYDSVAPTFDIRYLDRNQSPAVYLTASGATVNSITRTTLEVTNALSDIASYEVLRGSTEIRKEVGTGSNLQTFLRTIQTNGTYRVIVMDRAMNRSEISFDVRVEPPSLPSSRTLIVNGNDDSPIAGVNATIEVEFDPSSDVNISSDPSTYRLFVNGRPVQATIAAGLNGRVRMSFDIKTAFYGDLEYIYEVQAVDIHGNIAKYNLQTGAVIRDRSIPTARVLSTESTDTTITALIELNDFNRVLTSAGAKAELYNGTVLVATIPLSLGTQSYTFSALRDRQVNYNIKIVGSYTMQSSATVTDATLNGASAGDKYLIDTLRLNPEVTGKIENIRSTQTSITLDVTTLKNVNQARLIDVFLFEGVGPYTGNPVKSQRIDLVQAVSSATTEVEFTGLTVGKNYHIQVREGGYLIATARHITNLLLPTSSYSVVAVEQNQATVNVSVANLTNPVAYVFQGNDLVNPDGITLLNGLNRRVITGLLPNVEYTLKVLGDYDVWTETQNGSMSIVQVTSDLIEEYTFKTAKRLPTGSIPAVLIDIVDDEVLFSVILDDPDNALIRASVVLYEGDAIVNQIAIDPGRSNLKFENLKSDTDYVLSIHVTYDLDDDKGEVSRSGRLTPSALTPSFVIQPFKTIKTIPTVEVASFTRTNTTLTLVLQPTDPDAAFVAGTVRIFGDQASPLRTETLVRTTFQRETAQTITFTGLAADSSYRVEIELDYNILDGRGVRTYKPVVTTYRTMPNISIDVVRIRPSTSQLSIDLNLRDFSGQSVLARLFRGESQVGNAIPVSNNESTVSFDQLEANTSYRLIIDYNNGAQLLVSRDIQTRTLTTLTTPTAAINVGAVADEQVTINLTLVDVDLTVVSIAEVVVCDSNSDECVTETRTVSQLVAGTQIPLAFDEQTITVKLDYDVQTSAGTLELPTNAISLSEPTPEPTPEPEPEPVPTDPPSEPIDLNLGVLVASVVGALAVGFVGVFVYSFRKMYLR